MKIVMIEASFYTPPEIADYMLADRQVIQGVDPATHSQTRRVFDLLPGLIQDLKTPDVVAVQAVGSRVNGYAETQSDLDLLTVHFGAVRGNGFRAALSEILYEQVDVSCVHPVTGHLDVDDLMTLNLDETAPMFYHRLQETPGDFFHLFEDGVHASLTQQLARRACLHALQHGFTEPERHDMWHTIQAAYEYVHINGGRDPRDMLKVRLAERAGTEAMFTEVDLHITDDLLQARTRQFALPGFWDVAKAYTDVPLPAVMRSQPYFEVYQDITSYA